MWEYTEISGWVNATADLMVQLNAHGSLGWEAVGITSMDRTLGLNGYIVIMRRKVLDWPPATGGPGWAADPTGRFAQRYWDGLRWTEHVTDRAGTASTDFPNRRAG